MIENVKANEPEVQVPKYVVTHRIAFETNPRWLAVWLEVVRC